MTAQNDKNIKKKLFWNLLITATVLFTIISLVLSPIISVISNNIVYAYTLLPDVLILLTDILNLIALSVCSAIIIYSITKFGMQASSSLLTVYVSAFFLKYSADMLVSYLILHTLDASVIISYAMAFLIDLILILIIAFIAYRAYRSESTRKKVAVTSAIIVSLSKVLSRIIYDISYGAPTDLSDLIWMIVYYLSDLLVGAIFVLISMHVFKHLTKKETAE